MVRWYHAIFTAYGFWLPNDPRGSWSDFVGSWELYKFGVPTTTSEKRSLAHDPYDVELRREAKHALRYPPARFDQRQRDLIADGIAQACDESDLPVHACAIGYDHVHTVVGRHAKTIEQVVHHFKSRATKHMNRTAMHPLRVFAGADGTTPCPWAEGCWHVFINDERQLKLAIDYVNGHPQKEGLPAQRWAFVSPV